MAKQSYVPEAMTNRPVQYRTRGRGRRRGGSSTKSRAAIGARRFDRFLTEDWLPLAELDLEPTSYQSIEGIVRRHVAPRIGAVRIRDITTEGWRDFYADLLRQPSGRDGRPLSKNTVIRVHSTVHRALESLVESGVLDRNPARGARPRHRKSERYEPMVWTPEELAEFLEAVTQRALRVVASSRVDGSAQRGGAGAPLGRPASPSEKPRGPSRFVRRRGKELSVGSQGRSVSRPHASSRGRPGSSTAEGSAGSDGGRS